MNFTTNWSEDYVDRMYRAIDIHHPHQLDLEDIAARNGLEVFYLPTEPMNIGKAIILDDRVNDRKSWQDFGHELCHALWHAGGQISVPMPFQVYQEAKANNFAQYACIPSFMLTGMKLPDHERASVGLLMETFGVDQEFAEKRLTQYLRNLRASY